MSLNPGVRNSVNELKTITCDRSDKEGSKLYKCDRGRKFAYCIGPAHDGGNFDALDKEVFLLFRVIRYLSKYT